MLACNWISRGEASAPKKEPKILVGELTGLITLPNVGEAMSASGWSKCG
jgi:hypothetical protein